MSSWPLLQFVQDLEGFEFAAFLLGLAVVFFSVGFAIDYVIGRSDGPLLERLLRPGGRLCGAVRSRLVASTLLRLRSLFDDRRGRRRVAHDNCHGKRGRQPVKPSGLGGPAPSKAVASRDFL